MRHIASAVCAIFFATFAIATQAQSTLGDPTPVMGNQAASIAGTTAMNGAINAHARNAQGGSRYTASRDVRDQHRAQMKACRNNYQANTRSGSPERKAARDACKSRFDAQRASWKQ
jgi:hypothetical protein